MTGGAVIAPPDTDEKFFVDTLRSNPNAQEVLFRYDNFQKLRDALAALIVGEGDSWDFINASAALKQIEEAEKQL